MTIGIGVPYARRRGRDHASTEGKMDTKTRLDIVFRVKKKGKEGRRSELEAQDYLLGVSWRVQKQIGMQDKR